MLSHFFSNLLSFRAPAKPWSVFLVFLSIGILAYGGMTPSLGFYGDEWHMVYEFFTRQGEGLARYFYFDAHPTVTWIYAISFQFLGVNPLLWQWYGIFLRVISVFCFWLLLDRVWPEQRLETFFAASIFAVYPYFTMQAMAVAYFEVWLSYAVLWLSIYCSVRVMQEPQKIILWGVLSLVFKGIHLFTSEYTWGTELMRFGFLLCSSRQPSAKHFRMAFVSSFIYLALSAVMFFWRSFVYASPVAGRADAVLVQKLLENPVDTVWGVLLLLLPDLAMLFLFSWSRLFQPAFFDFNQLFNVTVFFLALVSGGLYFWYGRSLVENESEPKGWKMSWFWLGIFGALAGLVPFYVAGYAVLNRVEPYSGRISLGSIGGIALLVTAVLSFFVTSPRRKLILFAVLAGLMVSWQNQATNFFRLTWNQQDAFYRELVWRAPQIEPGTALIFLEPSPVPLLERSRSFVINAIYHDPDRSVSDAPYWYFSVNAEKKLLGFNFVLENNSQLRPLAASRPLRDQKYDSAFQGDSKNALFFSYPYEAQHCVWLAQSYLAEYLGYPTLTRNRSAAQILAEDSPRVEANLKDFWGPGPDVSGNWCYFYQKAGLATDQKNWRSVRQLWQESQTHFLRPSHGVEYLPFIHAFAMLGDWNTAYVLTRKAHDLSPDTLEILCHQWYDFERLLPDSPGKAAKVKELLGDFSCKK